MLVYYSHCLSIYNTKQEIRDLELISKTFPDADIFNPNSPEHSKEYKEKGMSYFTTIIKKCDVVVFRGLINGKIPAGCAMEIHNAKVLGIPVLELPTSILFRTMNVEQTREYLKESGCR